VASSLVPAGSGRRRGTCRATKSEPPMPGLDFQRLRSEIPKHRHPKEGIREEATGTPSNAAQRSISATACTTIDFKAWPPLAPPCQN